MKPNRPFRLFCCSLLLCTLAGLAHADNDPPGRVARLDHFDGSVTFAPAGSEDWVYAKINRPLTTGDKLWVDQGGRAELHVGSTALHLNSKTSLEVSTLDDNTLQLKESQGNIDLHVRKLWDGQSVEIDTPNLAFVVRKPGVYRVDVDPTANTTFVTVRHGDAIVYGSNDTSREVPAGQAMQFGGSQLDDARAFSLPAQDGFDHWAAERDHREDDSVSARYVSRETIGYQDLDAHGTWRDVDGYGPVWTPTVTIVNWAPYRYGHWAWVAPWGWTWVDDAPWGFAPFHYGRWAYIGGGWGWIPGPIMPRPVYAPALVAFAGGGGGGFHWGISLSVGTPGVAWFPLGPGEIYRPAYAVSPAYVTNINHTVNVNNTTIVNNNTVINKTVYVNQNVPNAVTAVPAATFVKGQSVAQANTSVNPAAFKTAQMSASPAVAPVSQSLAGAGTPAPASAVPPSHIVARDVVSTHAPATPPALNDTLAHQYIAQGHTVSGAGPLPPHLTAPINAAANVPQAASPHSTPPPLPEQAKASPPPLPGNGVPHPPPIPSQAAPASSTAAHTPPPVPNAPAVPHPPQSQAAHADNPVPRRDFIQAPRPQHEAGTVQQPHANHSPESAVHSSAMARPPAPPAQARQPAPPRAEPRPAPHPSSRPANHMENRKDKR